MQGANLAHHPHTCKIRNGLLPKSLTIRNFDAWHPLAGPPNREKGPLPQRPVLIPIRPFSVVIAKLLELGRRPANPLLLPKYLKSALIVSSFIITVVNIRKLTLPREEI
jgi:hypothetical protein